LRVTHPAYHDFLRFLDIEFDKTLVSLAENALQYGAAAKAAGKKLSILRYVASDGAA